ncbi:MAG: hypothetical protein Q4D41_12910, partial [Prevotellaceae bacterium]|nr:hypothetical protein [Prevotellaceae bacterium]
MKSIKLLISMLALVTTQAFAQENFRLWMDEELAVTADGSTVTYLTVYQNDPDVNYTAFNMTLAVPKGIHINTVTSGRETVDDIALSERGTSGHTIVCKMPDDVTLNIACYSGKNLELYPDDESGNPCDALFTIGLIADNSTYNSKYQINMSGISFTYRDANGQLQQKVYTEPTYTYFNVTGGTDFPGVDYTLTSDEYNTLIVPVDCDIPSGMNVYSCNGFSEEGKILIKEEASIVANTPYIVKGQAGTYHMDGPYSGILYRYSTTYMTGVYVSTEVPVNSYVLINQEPDGLGFYKVKEKEESGEGEETE